MRRMHSSTYPEVRLDKGRATLHTETALRAPSKSCRSDLQLQMVKLLSA